MVMTSSLKIALVAIGLSVGAVSLEIYRDLNNARSSVSSAHSPQPARQSEERDFPLEKILTVSAEEYCQSVGCKLSDYHLQGISGYELEKLVPPEAEVVVGLDVEYSPGLVGRSLKYAAGTALIHKSVLGLR